jgi:pyrroloquinoline-quinone synthase
MATKAMDVDTTWYENLMQELVAKNIFRTSEYFKRFGTGELTKEQAWGHLSQQYLLIKYFPRVFSGIHARCEVLEIRKECAKHLLVEDLGYFQGTVGKTPDHVELFKRIGDDLGIGREVYDKIEPIPEMAAMLNQLRRLAHEIPWPAALCTTSLGETQTIDASRVVGNALMKYYGCRPEWGGLNYIVHEKVEEEEAGDTEAVVLQYIKTKADRAEAENAMRDSEGLRARYADALCRRYLHKG